MDPKAQWSANLDSTIGLGARNVLLPNFNTALFFRTAEETKIGRAHV